MDFVNLLAFPSETAILLKKEKKSASVGNMVNATGKGYRA